MTKPPLALVSLVVMMLALWAGPSGAQSQDPHLPPPPSLPALNEFIQIDDMLLWPEQYQGFMTPQRNHGQANFRPGRDPAGQHVCHALADSDGGAATAAAREIRRLDIVRTRVRASAQQAADRAARRARRLTP